MATTGLLAENTAKRVCGVQETGPGQCSALLHRSSFSTPKYAVPEAKMMANAVTAHLW
jgi:hypothetical protein